MNDYVDIDTPSKARLLVLEDRGATVTNDSHGKGLARYEIDELYRQGLLPIEPDRFLIEIVDDLGIGRMATVVPFGTRYKPDGDGRRKTYHVEDTPEGFIVYVKQNLPGKYDFRMCVRHEVAHAIDWWQNGVTDDHSYRFEQIKHVVGAER